MKTPVQLAISRRKFLGSMGAAAAGMWCQTAGIAAAAPVGPLSSVAAHEARFYKPLADGSVACELCPRRCQVPEGMRGYCGVRENRGGKYYTLVYGRPSVTHQEGCHFVYCGNLPGLEGENTSCPSCKKIIIKRYGFRILENHLTSGKCAFCARVIPGVWA